MTEPSQKSPDLIAEEVAILFRHAPSALVGNLLGTLIVGAVLWGGAASGPLITWVAALWASLAVRYGLARAYRTRQPRAEDADRWGRLYTFSSWLIAALWGLGALLFLEPQQAVYRQIGLSISLAGIAASASGTLAARSWLAGPFILLVLLPMAGRYFLISEQGYWIMGTMVIIYTQVLLGVAHINHLGIAETLRLRFENLAMLRSLQESEGRFRALTEASSTAIFIIQNKRFIYGNPAALALSGYTLEELAVMDYWDLMHPTYREIIRRRGKARLADQPIATPYEAQIVNKRGEAKWVQFSSSKMFLDGKPAIVGSAIEVTERKRSEILLRQARDAAEAATRAKSIFLANMSHDIRTPMNGILGMAQLLELSPLNEEQRQYLAAIRDSGDALLVLINDILDFSKIEAGKLELEKRDFVLLKELESTLTLYRPMLEAKGLALQTTFDTDLPTLVRGDSTRLRQVLSNLLSNAVKFTHRGHIEVRASQAEDAKDPPDKVRLEFQVADTGIGIPEDRLDRLFRAFSQGDPSTTRQYGGSGLGLAICARLCEAMGGKIDIESQPGIGSRVRFQVLLERGAGEPRREKAGKHPPVNDALSHVRAMVVDDVHINRRLAVGLLARLGIQADAVSSGGEAVERARTGAYDLILMDMQMPHMDGLEATRLIREIPLPAQPTIIALTANAFESDRERCHAAGMDAFISKPFRLDELRSKVIANLRPR